MGFLTILLARLKPWVSRILSVALGVSLLANLGLGLYARHQSGLYQKCREAVVVTTVVAVEKKEQTEKRNDIIVRNSQDRVTTRVGNALERLRSQGRSGNLSVPATSPAGSQPAGGTSVVLPGNPREADSLTQIQEKDREVCVTNTILLEEFQKFYSEIRESMAPDRGSQPSPVSPSPTP